MAIPLGNVYGKTASLRLRRASDAGALSNCCDVPAGGTSAANY